MVVVFPVGLMGGGGEVSVRWLLCGGVFYCVGIGVLCRIVFC